ncbi:MAG: hypothetical protein ACPG8W_01795 [Candidatus Promineifilaceae bacterium]
MQASAIATKVAGFSAELDDSLALIKDTMLRLSLIAKAMRPVALDSIDIHCYGSWTLARESSVFLRWG